jgi:hypothetical protein
MDVVVGEVDGGMDGVVGEEGRDDGDGESDALVEEVAEQHNNEQLVLAYRCIPLNQCTFQRL